MSAIVVPFSSPMTNLALGYDTSVNRVKASPFMYEPQPETVLFHSNNDREDGSSQTAIQYQLRFVESRSDLAESLSISGKFAARRANISGSLSGAFLDQSIDNKKNVYVLVTVEVLHSVTSLASTPEIDSHRIPKESEEAEQFFQLYGDGYVAAIHVGGRLDGLVEVTARDESDLLSIKAEAKVKVQGVASGELSLDYVVGNLTKDHQTRVTCNVVGGGIGFSPMDPRSLVRLCKAFPLMVNGGESELQNFEVKFENGKEVQDNSSDLVKFPGIAVPMRAVVIPYKTLPAFNEAPPVLSRLSGYITDDLLEYYLSYDDAKNKVADLISNENETFIEEDLKDLNKIRSELREVQSSLLGTIDNVEVLKHTEAAISASDTMKTLKPAENYLWRASEVQNKALERNAEEQRTKDLEARRLLQIREQARQQILEFQRNSLDLGDDGISTGEDVYISQVTVPIKDLYVGDADSAFKWILEADERTLPVSSLQESSDKAFQIISLIHAKGLRAAYNLRQQDLVMQFYGSDDSNSSITKSVYIAIGNELRDKFIDEESFFTYILELRTRGESNLDQVLEPITSTLLALSTVDTVAKSYERVKFTVEIIDGNAGLAHISYSRPDDNKKLYWRHILQKGLRGIISTEERDEALEDNSFVFKLLPNNFSGDNSTAEISPDAGLLDWRLIVVPQITPNSPMLICTVPLADVLDTEARTFKITLAESA